MQDNIEQALDDEALAVQISAATHDIPARIGDHVADIVRRAYPEGDVEITIRRAIE